MYVKEELKGLWTALMEREVATVDQMAEIDKGYQRTLRDLASAHRERSAALFTELRCYLPVLKLFMRRSFCLCVLPMKKKCREMEKGLQERIGHLARQTMDKFGKNELDEALAPVTALSHSYMRVLTLSIFHISGAAVADAGQRCACERTECVG